MVSAGKPKIFSGARTKIGYLAVDIGRDHAIDGILRDGLQEISRSTDLFCQGFGGHLGPFTLRNFPLECSIGWG